MNAQDGIAGRATLVGPKKWSINDDGLDPSCVMSGVVSYSPSTPTSGNVTATLTLNMTGSVTTSGWTTVNGTTFTRVYTGNATGTVGFINVYGYTGTANVNIYRIDTDAPYATSVVYSPNGFTTGNVSVTMTINEPVQAISGRTG